MVGEERVDHVSIANLDGTTAAKNHTVLKVREYYFYVLSNQPGEKYITGIIRWPPPVKNIGFRINFGFLFLFSNQ
jgi:hypothetical protein